MLIHVGLIIQNNTCINTNMNGRLNGSGVFAAAGAVPPHPCMNDIILISCKISDRTAIEDMTLTEAKESR